MASDTRVLRSEAMAEDAAGPTYTAKPLRLRMTSVDMLCIRSMEIQWRDSSGRKHSWSSWTDELENGWYEAQKILPASVSDVRVRFLARGVGGPYVVFKVDRRRNCIWTCTAEHGYEQEEFCLRPRSVPERLHEPVDIVFALTGAMTSCYVERVWNAARTGMELPWEYWNDAETRPSPAEALPVLGAADAAASLRTLRRSRVRPELYYECSTKRMCAGLKELLHIHRRTMRGIRKLELKFDEQWTAVNVGNTASAALGIASAALLFLSPPVGIGFGVASATTGSGTLAADSLSDRAHLADLKRQLAIDDLNAFAVAELLKEWMTASRSCSTGGGEGGTSKAAQSGPGSSASTADTSAEWEVDVDGAVDNGLLAGGMATNMSGTAARMAASIGPSMSSAAQAAGQVIGVAGALIGTCTAIRGWTTSKFGQTAIRARIADLTLRIRQVQHLIAGVDHLECGLCLKDVKLGTPARRCRDSHVFHAECLRRWDQRPERAGCCPKCKSPLEENVAPLGEVCVGAIPPPAAAEDCPAYAQGHLPGDMACRPPPQQQPAACGAEMYRGHMPLPAAAAAEHVGPAPAFACHGGYATLPGTNSEPYAGLMH
eukprot:TRINITY_DN4262_c0_g2_i1.p1 TRINITY_DN4262_c0_g2~~TRINITY_DN4262_c0_g2_i1.p1  ORF type:complete len:602 (+),score=97.81 TRINITY_DN4262_c0_g2_i1:150-1955(+)